MNEATTFKSLVITSWILQFTLYLFSGPLWQSDPMIEKLMRLDGYGAILLWDNHFIYQIPLWGFLVASIGMLQYKNWARYLYTTLWLYSWFATLLFGFRISPPAQGFIGMAIGSIDGALIYLIFASTLRMKFTSVSKNQTQH